MEMEIKKTIRDVVDVVRKVDDIIQDHEELKKEKEIMYIMAIFGTIVTRNL